MGAGMLLGKWLGKTLGGALKVPTKDGIMFPREWSYAKKIEDLAHETHKVAQTYLNDLVQEAYRRHDIAALKVIYDYSVNVMHMSVGTGFVKMLIRYGQDIIVRNHVGNPFALVESVVRHLC